MRGKLIEINMVMNIVRIALIVLAMVFSASPLPFSSVETQMFFNCWWGGVGLFIWGCRIIFMWCGRRHICRCGGPTILQILSARKGA